jgi:hypothetical protein
LFEKWFKEKFPRLKNYVYVFWGNKKKCLYVGKTGKGGSRISSHFIKHWFGSTRRIDIFSSTASQIPKLECLAIHHFEPVYNKNKAATKNWTKKCPLCTIHKDIEKELRKIFRLR